MRSSGKGDRVFQRGIKLSLVRLFSPLSYLCAWYDETGSVISYWRFQLCEIRQLLAEIFDTL